MIVWCSPSENRDWNRDSGLSRARTGTGPAVSISSERLAFAEREQARPSG
mgnify:CR=1 FL=1